MTFIQDWSGLWIILSLGILGAILSIVTFIVSKKYPEALEQKIDKPQKTNLLIDIAISIITIVLLIIIILLVLSHLNMEVADCYNCTIALS